MIDTDKYEGHTEGKREIQHNAFIHIEERGLYATIAGGFTIADVELIADVPLLLAEVKRLVLVADELYLHIVGEPHMTLDELVAKMWWRDEEE